MTLSPYVKQVWELMKMYQKICCQAIFITHVTTLVARKKGGVGIFYKDTLPIKIRSDLSFDECIVAELHFGRKEIFFNVLYRNPIHKASSPEFLCLY